MDAPANSGRRISSGLFEVDLASGEILRQGRLLSLQEQPFRVLALLLERPGQIVTREQMKAMLWPADTYVGFDEGLNTAVRKLRVLFGDSADNPRFIETVPRRGYRFIAPVTELPDGSSVHGQSAGRADSEVKPTTVPESDPGFQEKDRPASAASGSVSPPSRRRIWIWVLSIAAAVILVAVLAAAAHRIYFRASPGATPVKRAMLAVLPFQNLSNDPSHEYFSDGLTEETITDLGQLSPAKLGVIARTSAMAYKHSDKTVSQIGRELGVDYILEGSVRRENERTRVSAQLIRVSDQTHVWAQTYDDRKLNLLDVENAIGRAIAEQVQIQITPQSQLELSKTHPVTPEAYDLYLQGRFYWNQRTPPSIRESAQLFQRAIAADPRFALAYAGLADAYNIGNIIGLYSPEESLPQARAAATRAIELDPTLAEAHAALGMEKSHYEFDFPGAQAEFLKAIDLNPSSAYAHFFYSNCYLMPMGRRAEAVAENKKALELDPLSLPINNFMGETYLLAGDYSRSYQQFQHTIAMAPNFPLAHFYFAGLLEQMGRYEDAIKENEKAQLLSGSTPEEATKRATMMRNALKGGGERGYWKEHLAQDLREAEKSGALAASSYMALVYALAGDKDKAFEFLEKAYRAREGSELTLLAVDPAWNNLHGDPRFSDLLRRIGLPELPANGEPKP